MVVWAAQQETNSKNPCSESTQYALYLANHVAWESGARRLEVEHLLIGLMRADGSLIQRLAMHRIAGPSPLHHDSRVSGAASTAAIRPLPPTDAARRALLWADAHAHVDEVPIAPEHILLGVLTEDAFAADVLRAIDVTVDSVREYLEKNAA